jgi:diguanylate cyclase (GGDEF)-like protein
MVMSGHLKPRLTLVKLAAVVGAVGVGAYYLVPRGSVGAHAAYEVVACFGVAAMVVGLLRNRPQDRNWLLIFLGLALWAAGDTYWNAFRWSTGHEAPFPSAADLFYLVCYVPLIAGVVGLVRGGRPRMNDFIDGAIAGVGALLIVWFAVLEPVAKTSAPHLLPKLVATAYPVADIILMLALIQLMIATGVRTPALRFLCSAFALVLVTDTVYARARLDATFSPGSWLDAGYLFFYVLLGCAFLSPSMGTLHAPPPATWSRVSPTRLLGLSAPLLVAPFFIVTGHAANEVGSRVLGGAAAALGLLVFARLVLVFRERQSIDEARLTAQAQLQEMAYRDPLTGVANRYALYDAVETGIKKADALGSAVAILFVDLDRFKAVNDKFGHAEGDQVLRNVASRLKGAVRDGDVVARHGGDEFVIMMQGLSSGDALKAAGLLATRIEQKLLAPFEVAGQTCEIGVTIGLSAYPTDGVSADELIDAADRAMYRGKESARESSARDVTVLR